MKNNFSKILNIIVSIGIGLTLILLAGVPFILGALSKSSEIVIESKFIINKLIYLKIKNLLKSF